MKHIDERRIEEMILKLKLELADETDMLMINLLKKLKPSQFEDLWLQQDEDSVIISYWVYISNDINDDRESRVTRQLLFWREFNGKSLTKIKFLQITDHPLYQICIKRLNPIRIPALIISDSPFFEKYIDISADALFSLDNRKIFGLFNAIQREIAIGTPVESIKTILEKEWPAYQADFEKVRRLISSGRLNEALDEINNSFNLATEAKNQLLILRSELSSRP